jgi:hypothetical protein
MKAMRAERAIGHYVINAECLYDIISTGLTPSYAGRKSFRFKASLREAVERSGTDAGIV